MVVDPYFPYIIAAYSTAFGLLSILIISTVHRYYRAQKAANES